MGYRTLASWEIEATNLICLGGYSGHCCHLLPATRNKGGKLRVLNSPGIFFAFQTLWDGTTAWGVHLCFLFGLLSLFFFSYLFFNSSVLFEKRDTLNLVSGLSALSLETINLKQWRLEAENTRLLSCGLGPRASYEQEVGSVHRVSLQRI
ncbi:hypothetical protein E4T42_01582 [Aureobasidium subglaciale]|nr:hypothetical protein E4T38_05235 [Aureobasidium subglaciale]KAI5220389.1 hypothetical protein E4T40_05999 [Aureobasidium subglaciale]KAI5222934.1 hypothetical protein E4T41_06425 [Aureobasidium subglaciale]KAI5256254.1 hypothetical protein E4T42_01582 [Aureobasidium subglaciale]KAI5260112.1 hypothetical protein E4T46_06307 [Aureobasidium subglaciale]